VKKNARSFFVLHFAFLLCSDFSKKYFRE